MPFFMVDDQLQANAKVTALIEREGAAGRSAICLWTLAGSLAQAKLSDGAVSLGDCARLLLDRPAASKAARLLVSYRLWHGPDHDCEDCPPVEAGGYVFHDWFQMGYDPGAKVKAARKVRKELRNPALMDQVWARDQSTCRYCGRAGKRGDRKSPTRLTIDHVRPGMARGLSNMVLACLPCNQRKMQRTPEQAGMTLMPEPNQPIRSNPDEPESIIDQHLISATPHRHGPGQGQGLGSDPGLGTGSADLEVPGQFGSAYHGHRGPPLADADQCDEHRLDLPCRRCRLNFTTEGAE